MSKPKTREEKRLQQCFKLATEHVYVMIGRLCQQHPSGISFKDLEAVLGRAYLPSDPGCQIEENPLLEKLYDAVTDAMRDYSGDVLEDILSHLSDEGRITWEGDLIRGRREGQEITPQ